MTTPNRYWIECISEAAFECDANLSDDQIECIAEYAQMGHEQHSQSTGLDVLNANRRDDMQRDIDGLQAAIQTERNKVHCRECDGNGTIVSHMGTLASRSRCWKCNGEGRHDP